jgi:hypothetical protein
MQVGDIIERGGFVTQAKFIKGRSLAEVENLLGFHKGRLDKGMYVACLAPGQSLPVAADFELRGYSQIADHRWGGTGNYDVAVLKKIATNAWEESGANGLVKVFPVVGHDSRMKADDQYPPGGGIPQWKLVKGLTFKIVAFVSGYPQGRWS